MIIEKIITDDILIGIRDVSSLSYDIVKEFEKDGVTDIKDFSEQPEHKFSFNNTYLAILKDGKGILFTCPEQSVVSFLREILNNRTNKK